MSASNFLKSVLGEDGAEALSRAHRRVPALGAVLAPRTIISWLTTAVRIGYEGEIPGVENTYISLNKTQLGFTGLVTIGDDVHKFEDSDVLHVAASIGVAIGLGDEAIDPQLKKTDLSKLGQSIDLLVKARIVTKAFTEKLKEREESEEESPVEKIEEPGHAAAPKGPIPPQAPQSVAPATNKITKPPMIKSRELMVKKSESEHHCAECDLPQFRSGKFTGCMCVRALAKSIRTNDMGNSYKLQVTGLDKDEFETLVRALRG